MKISYNAPFTLLFALLAGVSFFLFLNNNLYSDLFVLQGKTNFDDWHWYVGTFFIPLAMQILIIWLEISCSFFFWDQL